MQDTAARLDKVHAAWTRAQDRAKALSKHSKHITSQLNDKAEILKFSALESTFMYQFG